MISARAARAERRTLQRAFGHLCVGTRGACCALWHGLGASPSSADDRGAFIEDRGAFIAGVGNPARPDAAQLVVCRGDTCETYSDFRQPGTRAWWWDMGDTIIAEKHGGLTHWHVYCGMCQECCVLCDEPCGCDPTISVCEACRRVILRFLCPRPTYVPEADISAASVPEARALRVRCAESSLDSSS